MIALIVAMDRNRLIGADNRLPWHLSADLRRFKRITMGKPVIMGRKTFESIGKPLSGRHNIIISRDQGYAVPDCTVARDIPIALAAAEPAEEVMVIGGVSIYAQLMPYAQRIYLTEIDAEFKGDAWFPHINRQDWTLIDSEVVDHDAQAGFTYRFLTLEKKMPMRL